MSEMMNEGAAREQSRPLLLLVVRNAIFLGFHLTVFLAFLSGASTRALLLCVGFYYLRMFGITAGYHRYFAHRSFKTSRAFQFVLALLGTLSIQKGVLWWAGHHRDHHRYSDTPKDLHSPRQQGFWWAHMGWFMAWDHWKTPMHRIRDFEVYPELRLLNRFWVVPFVLLCVLVYLTLGFTELVWGCFISTVALFHGTFFINSLAHVFGRQVYVTGDDSRNSMFLALLTMGEGWHNNHHYYPASARQGFHWWQIDMSWWVLWLLERFGLIWDVQRPSTQVVAGELRKGESKLLASSVG